MTEDGTADARPRPQLTMSDLPRTHDVESLKAFTGWVTCRVVEEHALLHCKRCGRGERVPATPRQDFLLAARAFVLAHDDCP